MNGNRNCVAEYVGYHDASIKVQSKPWICPPWGDCEWETIANDDDTDQFELQVSE